MAGTLSVTPAGTAGDRQGQAVPAVPVVTARRIQWPSVKIAPHHLWRRITLAPPISRPGVNETARLGTAPDGAEESVPRNHERDA